MNVVHCKREPYDVYIGRPSKWGNPFVVGLHGTREEVIRKYRTYLRNRDDLLADLHELRGKTLGCWCDPLPCHGWVLVEAVFIEAVDGVAGVKADLQLTSERDDWEPSEVKPEGSK